MSNSTNVSSRIGAFCLVAVSAGALMACDPNVGQAIAQAESFNFSYQRLQPDGQGKYALRMNLGSGCKDYLFNVSELADALRTKQFQLTHSSPRVTVTANLTFDAISECDTARQEVRYETALLSEEFMDAATGNKARRRPHDPNTLLANVVTELSPGGVMQVAVFGITLSGTTTSRTAATGPIELTSADVPAPRVGSPASGLLSHANLNPSYVEARLTNVLANPNRFAAEFAFLAKAPSSSNEVLLVWDGDLVLRTDIED